MNYTEPAKEVLKKAEKIARELDHPYVGTEHLLLAFMRVCTGVAGQILSANGVEEANLYKIVDELISPVGEVTFREKPKRSPRLEYTLEESKEEAQKTTVSQSNARKRQFVFNQRQLEQSICSLQSFGNRTVLQPEYF